MPCELKVGDSVAIAEVFAQRPEYISWWDSRVGADQAATVTHVYDTFVCILGRDEELRILRHDELRVVGGPTTTKAMSRKVYHALQSR